MIRVLLFDLGKTLVRDAQAVLPHVPEALDQIAGLRTATGEALVMGVVSDFGRIPEPALPEQIAATEEEMAGLLEGWSLRRYFEPIQERVTLSTHTGVQKPDCRVFQMALLRMSIRANLDECLFVTEEPEHIRHCRRMGMETLWFDMNGQPGADFHDWREAPALIAQKLRSP